MDSILLLLHTEPDGSLPRSAWDALGAAKTCAADDPLLIGLLGANIEPAARALAGAGAARILGVAGPSFAQARYATDAAAAAALCRTAEASIVIAPATSRWNRVLPGVAHRLGGRTDTHITQVRRAREAWSVHRWYYRQRIEATLSRAHRPWFILLEPGAQPPAQAAPGDARIETVPVEVSAPLERTTVLGTREPGGQAQTIRPDAPLLFVAGAGWTKKQADGQTHPAEAAQLIARFLELTRASLGSSKSLVDLSGEGHAVLPFLTHLNQVGQTGSTPRHAKGLATCCHGEEPHTVGWRFIGERRAINLDPNCGWARGKADVLYIADAFAVLEKLNRLLACPTKTAG